MDIKKSALLKVLNIVKTATGKNELGGSRTDYLIHNGYIFATNGATVVSTKIDTSESMVLPNKCANLIKALPDEIITIIGNDENIKVSCGKIKNVYKTTPVKSYILPEITLTSEKELLISAEELVTAINKVGYAVANTSVNRPQLLGVNIRCDNGYLNFAGADGHRVSWFKIKTDNKGYLNVTVPKDCIEIIKSIHFTKNIKITFNSNWISFADDNTTIKSRLIDGDFVSYENFFANLQNKVIIDKHELIECISRIKAVSEEDRPKIILKLSTDNLKIELKESNVNYSEDLCIGNDNELKVAFNANYILDAIKNIDKDKLEVYVNTNKSPFIFINNKHKALVLPVNMDN